MMEADPVSATIWLYAILTKTQTIKNVQCMCQLNRMLTLVYPSCCEAYNQK